MAAQQTHRILVVEDDQDIRDLMVLHLERAGHKVESVADGTHALKSLGAASYDLVVLDWMIPAPSGVEVVAWLRRRQNTVPVMMVTARSSPQDIVEGLQQGADDFVTKPFETKIFLARVSALLRRGTVLKSEKEVGQARQVGSLTLNPEAVEVHCDGKLVALTLSEFKLLDALMASVGKVLTREKLIEQVQGSGVNVVDRVVDTHVFGLRKKLGPCGALIETVRGIGYRVCP